MNKENIALTHNISGVILAGGANSRFNGITKSNIVIGGKPIIDRIFDRIGNIFSEIIIVTNTPDEFARYTDCKIVSDIILNKGPLGGIHAALQCADNEAVFVFAGDMPMLDKELIIRLIDSYKSHKYEVMIPSIDNYIEPLHSIYSKSLLIPLEEFLSLNNNRAVRDFIKGVNAFYLNLESTEKVKMAFYNINSHEDVLLIEKLLKTNQ